MFSDGFRFRSRESNRPSVCVVNGKEAFHILNEINDVFLCNVTIPLHDNDSLSLRLTDGSVIPSLVTWKRRLENVVNLGYKVPLCCVTMVKNEEKSITDWLEYHMRQGIGLFYIYGNNCTDNTSGIIEKYNSAIWIDWPWHKSQVEAFTHGALLSRHNCRWTFFIDVDEYIFPAANRGEMTVEEIIKKYTLGPLPRGIKSNYRWLGQICLETKAMGTSNKLEKPREPVVEAYIHFDQWWMQEFGKCAISPQSVNTLSNIIHRFDVRGETIVLPKRVMHIVHYRLQCWKCFLENKYDKGQASGLVSDINSEPINRSKPDEPWLRRPGPVDTVFRDYKRRVDTWPLNYTPQRRNIT